MEEDVEIKELIEYIARCLAEHPEQVSVQGTGSGYP